MSGTSPLRRAREEVAVNIAVTGFVSKLLPSKTKALEAQLVSLRSNLRGQEKELNRLRTANNALQRSTTASTAAKIKSEEAFRDQQEKVNGLRHEIRNINADLRDHTGEMRRVITHIRGWGIAVGTASLLLGGMTLATLKLASDMQELRLSAFRAQITIEDLQRAGASYAVTFGDLDAGKKAASDLANFRRELLLVRHGFVGLDIGNLARGLAGSGISYTDLVDLNPEELRATIRKAITAAQGDPGKLKALELGLPEQVFNAAVLEQDETPRLREIRQAIADLNAVNQAQATHLQSLQNEWGLTTSSLDTAKNSVLVGLAPALNDLALDLHDVTSGVIAFSSEHPKLSQVMGNVTVATLALVTILGVLTLIQKAVILTGIFFRGTLVGNAFAAIFATKTLKGFVAGLRALRVAFLLLHITPAAVVLVGIGLALAFVIAKLRIFRRLVPGLRDDLDSIQPGALPKELSSLPAPAQGRAGSPGGFNPATTFTQLTPPRGAGNTVNVENNSTFNIEGTSDPEEVSRQVDEMQRRTFSSLTSSRQVGLGFTS